jgi:glycosyltransferase involved in cell wall biosynthesis
MPNPGFTRAQTGPLNVLAIHEMLPHPDRHGADLQWMQMLEELRAEGHQITHIARSAVNRARYAPPLEALGIKVLTPDAERLRFLGFDFPSEWSLEALLTKNNFDLAILFHWFWNGISIPEHYLEDIRQLSPDTFIAVLTDDQQGLREMQLADLTKYWADYERSHDFSSREMEVYRRADVLLTISEDDRKAFLGTDPTLRTGAMPMIAAIGPAGLPFADRQDVLFLANFDNPANRDAIDWMLSEIWPSVRKDLPAANLALVGNNLPPKLGASQPGIRRVGYIADLAPVFGQCRIAASPVRFGTGIKTKNLLALAHGLPLVTTTVGADGLSLAHNQTALIADSARDFSAAVVSAYTNETQWRALSENGRQLITTNFSRQRMNEAVRTLIEQARTLEPKPREPSFQWSYRIVEDRFPEVLTNDPPTARGDLRIARYLVLAEDFLVAGQPQQALNQLRHIFAMLRSPVAVNGPNLRAIDLLADCYQKLGDPKTAAEYRKKPTRHLWIKKTPRAAQKNQTSPRPSANHLARRPFFSVTIPTCNRQPILQQCLQALEQQSLSPGDFEVIAVDDGSTDSTEAFCKGFNPRFAFQYLRQVNAGAGAARRRAVSHARGDFLLCLNDDSIASPDLLQAHKNVHLASPGDRIAVLGNFQLPPESSNHALTRFLAGSPFLFPQNTLRRGKYWEYTYFITCNLSVAREAVLAAGSFDPQLRVAEDSDLGLRLSQKGFCVRYVPEAIATHQHLPFTLGDLIRRAEAYGPAQLALLRKHPALLGDGRSLFGMLDQSAAKVWHSLTAGKREEIESTVKQLERIDALDFSPFLAMSAGERTAADEITKLFRRAVPDVYWYYFFSSLLDAWNQKSDQRSARTPRVAIDPDEVFL